MCVFLSDTCFTVHAVSSNYKSNYEYMLARKLLEDYKPRTEVRPVARQDDPIIVTFDLAYSQLVDLVCDYL